MSAIYGVLGEAHPAEIEAMGERLGHRGSGDREWTPVSGVHLGLRARSESASTDAPIVFDGFLDNTDELAGLLGMSPDEARAAGDAAMTFAIFRGLGPDGLCHLNGHFAFVLWDASANRLVLARDRYGGRPLYYTRTGTRTPFASEYKALLALEDVPARPNRDAIQQLQCTKYECAEESFLQDVLAVHPGHWIAADHRQLESRRFWDVELRAARRTVAQHASSLRAAVLDSARRKSERYDPVGVSLSGGLDSAIAVAAIRKVSPDKTIHTFTAGFGPEDPEIVDAGKVAKLFETVHHEIVLRPQDLAGVLESMVWYLEDPAGREETAFLFVTSREASRYVEMLMSGYLADALFGGMPRHAIVRAALQFPIVRRPLQEFFAHSQAGLRPESALGRMLVGLYHRGKSYPYPRIIGAERLPRIDPLRREGEQPFSEFLRRVLLRGAAGQKVERLHSCFGISFDSPFMDSKVGECAFEIPDRLKIHGRTQKYILRQAFDGFLPDQILERKKTLQKLKHDRDLSEALDRLAEEILSPASVAARGLFETRYVEKLLSRPAGRAYPTDRMYRVWTTLLTKIWARLFLDRRGRPPETGLP